jgi:ATP-binding cassette subfamily B protein
MVDGPAAHRDLAGVWRCGGLLPARSTTDLRLRHDLVARVLPFLVANAVTMAVGAAIPQYQRWPPALILPAPVPAQLVAGPLLGTALLNTLLLDPVLLGHPAMAAAMSAGLLRDAVVVRRAQDQVGEFAAGVDESIVGVRVVKGLGRRREQTHRFRGLTSRLR